MKTMSFIQQTLKCMGMKVFITRNVPNPAIDILKKAGLQITQWAFDAPINPEDLKLGVKNVDAIYCLLTDHINEAVLSAAGSSLKVVSTMSVGYEHIDMSACRARSIKVGYTPEVLTDATAELAVALLLASSRRLFEGSNAVMQGQWIPWTPLWMCGRSLKGSTVGIVGLGRIGLEIAKRLQGFKVNQILYTAKTKKDYEDEVNAKFCSLDQLLKESDFVIVTCSLNNETRNLFTLDKFAKMKPTSIFINVSRGALVDQDALHSALTQGLILGAGLDVSTPEPLPSRHPLLSLRNCIVLPHIGSATVETREDMARLAADNIVAALCGKDMPAELVL